MFRPNFVAWAASFQQSYLQLCCPVSSEESLAFPAGTGRCGSPLEVINMCFLLQTMPYVMNLPSPCSSANPCSDWTLLSPVIVFKETYELLVDRNHVLCFLCIFILSAYLAQCLALCRCLMIIYSTTMHLNLDAKGSCVKSQE